MLLEEPGDVHAAGRRPCARTSRTCCSPAERRSSSPASTFEVLAVPGHSPAHLAYHADGCLFSGDVLFAGSVGRTDLPGADWETLSRRFATLARHAPARDRRLSRARADHDARRRARAEPVPRRAACGARRDESRTDRAPARHARRHPCRAAALAAGDDGDRATLRALRLPPDHDARVRGHRSLRADVGGRLRRRAEGDVHVRRPLRPLADAPPRGHRADLPRVRRARVPARAAAREALHDRVDVPVRRARARGATASTGRRPSRRSDRTTPRSTPS